LNGEVYFYTALTCIATLLNQNWIFQATQEFSKIAILSVLSKFILMILLILFVNKESDFKLVPLFIKYKMITPLGAGLISFLVDGTRTMLIAGTRSSGKSSFSKYMFSNNIF
jgi:uncharacterized integral membrane protein